MRSLPLLRLTLLVTVIAGAVVVGAVLFSSYWADVRRTVAYDMAREARLAPDAQREAKLVEALSVDPGNWLASLSLAQERLFAGKLPEAERLLDDAVRGNPRSPLANYTMGVVQFRRGSVAAALPYFEAAAALDPGNLQYEGMVKELRQTHDGGGTVPPDSESGPTTTLEGGPGASGG